jgi:hypothetical protein
METSFAKNRFQDPGSGEKTLEAGDQVRVAAEARERPTAEGVELGRGVHAVRVVEQAVDGAGGRRGDQERGERKRREKPEGASGARAVTVGDHVVTS